MSSEDKDEKLWNAIKNAIDEYLTEYKYSPESISNVYSVLSRFVDLMLEKFRDKESEKKRPIIAT